MFQCLRVLVCIVCFACGVRAQKAHIKQMETLEDFIAHSKITDWEVVQQKDGVVVSYRDLEFNDTIITRELCVKFKTQSTVEKVYELVVNPNKITDWNDAIKSMKTLKQTDSYWIAHSIYNIPFPLTKQDLVAKYWLERTPESLIIHVKAVPDYIPEVKGLAREAYNLSQWTFTPQQSGFIDVEFTGITLSDSKIPRFIKDPIIQRKLLHSFLTLKNLL
ncbi:hypothetical protein [Formosa sp. S-31]|uniref:hypothetical protein n=1 Tax=Formosa sp. S-31 TaxID=2790949 RepID=UPI003EBB8728